MCYGILNFTKKCQKDADSPRSAILLYFPDQISQQRFNQSKYGSWIVLDYFCELFPLVMLNS